MKPNTVTCLLFLFCVINLFFGCSRRKAAPLPELEQAEAVMFEHPDSALHILQRMPKPTDKEQHALWCLLVTQAMYKQYLPIPSDSLIQIAYDYYKPTDDARRKAMAALYMGEINYDLRKTEEAFVFYLEAVSNVESLTDYRLGYLVMAGIGNVYLFRGLTDKAFEVSQKAYDYAVQASYKRYEMGALNLLARCYMSKKDFDNAVLYYKRAIKMADSLDLIGSIYSIKGELASVYSILGQYNKSLALEKEVVCDDNPSLAQVYYAMGINYKGLNQFDSAYFYLKKALKTSNIYTRNAVFNVLYELSAEPPYQKYLRMYCDSMLFYRDSIYEIDKSKEIIAYEKKYENEKLITQNQQLELQRAHVTRWLLVLFIVILMLLVIIIYFYQHRKIILHQKEKELNNMAFKLHKNELLIERNNDYITELIEQISRKNETIERQKEQEELLLSIRKENEFLHKENDRLTNDIAERTLSPEIKELNRVTNELMQVCQQEEDMLAFIQRIEPFLSGLHRKPVCLNRAEMQNVRVLTDEIYPDFTRRLLEKVSLSEGEIMLCCFIKLHFSVSEIAIFMGISPTSVSTTKLRTKKKIYAALGILSQNETFDQWIWKH